jgi:hypothetical protein
MALFRPIGLLIDLLGERYPILVATARRVLELFLLMVRSG